MTLQSLDYDQKYKIRVYMDIRKNLDIRCNDVDDIHRRYRSENLNGNREFVTNKTN